MLAYIILEIRILLPQKRYLCKNNLRMKKYIYLSTCDTCKRIMKDAGITKENFELQDIKKTPISEVDLDLAFKHTNSYEALFNKRSRKYAQSGLKEQNLDDIAFRDLILSEYTYLKRPVTIVGSNVYVGNSKKEVQRLIEDLKDEK